MDISKQRYLHEDQASDGYNDQHGDDEQSVDQSVQLHIRVVSHATTGVSQVVNGGSVLQNNKE